MRKSRNLLSSICSVALLLVSGVAVAQSTPPASLIDLAQKQVVAYLDKLADLRCTEMVVQQKLTPNGKVEISAHSQYDYFLLMQGNKNDFQLSESRLETGTSAPKHASLLLTNGFSTLLLVFHPYYRSSFNFTSEAAALLDGHSVVPMHFAHVTGMRTPAALALRGREFPLELQGTAWLDAHSGQVLRIDASLLYPMTDVGLRSLKVHVEYMPSPRATDHFMLPSLAVVDLETMRQHWRNTHTFRDYKFFSTDAVQEPGVKVHAQQEPLNPGTPQPKTSSEVKENP